MKNISSCIVEDFTIYCDSFEYKLSCIGGCMLVRREEYLEKLSGFMDKPVIKVITGMRRCGKSTVMIMAADELKKNGVRDKNILYINKESLEFEFIQNAIELDKYVRSAFRNLSGKKYVFIDEVQEIKNWEKGVLSLQTDKISDIIITGSNAHLLSSELATLLSGRYVELRIFPLVFSEFLKFPLAMGKSADDAFRSFLKFGGLPGIHSFEDETHIYEYLNSVINTLLLKDVIRRNNIRDVHLLEKIFFYLLDNCGNITTAKSTSDFLKSQKTKVSVDTVQNYFRFLESAFMVYRIPRYDLKGKKYLEYYDKIYMGDTGLRAGAIGYKDRDISGILENIVLLELKKRGYDVSVGVQDGYEIDFIAQNKKDKIYIQVSRNLESEKTVQREFGNLLNINDNYRKYVITLDKFFPSDFNGITHQYLLDFLVNPAF